MDELNTDERSCTSAQCGQRIANSQLLLSRRIVCTGHAFHGCTQQRQIQAHYRANQILAQTNRHGVDIEIIERPQIEPGVPRQRPAQYPQKEAGVRITVMTGRVDWTEFTVAAGKQTDNDIALPSARQHKKVFPA